MLPKQLDGFLPISSIDEIDTFRAKIGAVDFSRDRVVVHNESANMLQMRRLRRHRLGPRTRCLARDSVDGADDEALVPFGVFDLGRTWRNARRGRTRRAVGHAERRRRRQVLGVLRLHNRRGAHGRSRAEESLELVGQVANDGSIHHADRRKCRFEGNGHRRGRRSGWTRTGESLPCDERYCRRSKFPSRLRAQRGPLA